LAYKEAREREGLPARMAALEAEQAAAAARLADPALHRASPQEAAALGARCAAIEEELLQLLERWTALEARQDGGVPRETLPPGR
jgi:ATP-binding cassette subfamily F protein uup